MARFASLCCLLALAWAPASNAATDLLGTVAERSGFAQTGRYAEVVRLCAAFQKSYPKAVRCVEFGRTPEGRPMLALIASRAGALTAKEARRRGLPVLLVQGGIHAGEIDGKDAGFLALRDVLANRAAAGALDRQVLVFVPVFNIDGHERFGRWNRPNQRGPEAMGWRTTAQNFNLNRDYAKADTAEMQAMLRLVNAWDPIACIDLHVTDGAKFEHDISIQVEPLHAGDAALRDAGLALRDAVIADLAREGSLPQPFYLSFEVDDDPEPRAPDSMVAWGAFNNAYERKEYMESYVAEEVAREQLAADPALAAEFHRRVAADAEFAKSPAARLDFFYMRHPSWDERFNLYPVMRTGVVPAQALRP